MGEEEREMSLSELINRLGDAQPDSIARRSLQAEFERRIVLWTRIGMAAATTGALFVAVVIFAYLK
jgi:hypothetical protein